MTLMDLILQKCTQDPSQFLHFTSLLVRSEISPKALAVPLCEALAWSSLVTMKLMILSCFGDGLTGGFESC